MSRYSAYTIDKIENEMTWEQVFVMMETIGDKLNQTKNSLGGTSQYIKQEDRGINKYADKNVKVRDYDLQDLVDRAEKNGGISAGDLGIPIEFKEVGEKDG